MHTNHNSFILELSDDETLHSLFTKTSQNPAEILSKQLKQCFEIKTARTMIKINVPEYRNKIFEITEIKFNLDLTEFINKLLGLSCGFTLAKNNQEFFLINENCIIKANFRKYFSNRLINYFNHNGKEYKFWVKTSEANFQFEIFKNTILKLIRILTGQLNLYERDLVKRRFYKVIYFLFYS